MAPNTKCPSCGAKRWMRDGQGGYVCRRGHAYIHQEELGDDEALLGTQTRSIKKSSRKSSSSKRSKGSEVIRLATHLRILQFQYSLHEQVMWLIEKKKMPSQLEIIVRDLWLLWLKQAGDSQAKTEVYYSSGLLKPCYTLVFIHIASFVLKEGLFYSDLVMYTLQEDFPYFVEDSINRYWQSNFGGYPSIPWIIEFQRYQTAILNQLYEAGFTHSFSLNQPNLVFRLMKELELPIECYALYKCISDLKGANFKESEPIWKCIMHIGVCCLFVARVYYSSSHTCIALISPLDMLVPQADISRPFISTMTRIISQKKKGVDKVAFKLFQQYTEENRISLKSTVKPHPSSCPSRKGFKSRIKSPDSPTWPEKVKSYFGKDINGAKCPVYASLMLRTCNLIGVGPQKLEAHSRAFDLLIDCYSLSFYSAHGNAQEEYEQFFEDYDSEEGNT